MATSQERINVPIFVSSTYEDLVPYRDEVERCIIRMNQTIRGMEFFGSNPESPLEVCLEMKEHAGGVRLNDSMYKRLILLDVIQ